MKLAVLQDGSSGQDEGEQVGEGLPEQPDFLAVPQGIPLRPAQGVNLEADWQDVLRHDQVGDTSCETLADVLNAALVMRFTMFSC